MKTITLISGSTLGGAEDLSEHLSGQLAEAGFDVKVLHGATRAEVPLKGLWLLITSTHGAGSLPDNLLPLFEDLQTNTPDLSRVQYGVIGLGDSSYDTFCQAARTADQILRDCGGRRIGIPLEIDVTGTPLIEDLAQAWLQNWLTQPLDNLSISLLV